MVPRRGNGAHLIRSHGVITGSPGSTVKIVLLKAGSEVGTISTGTSIGSGGTGSYTWQISSSGTTGNDYKISVQSISQPTVKDTCNDYLTIIPAADTEGVIQDWYIPSGQWHMEP